MLQISSYSGFGGRSDLTDWYVKGLSAANFFKTDTRSPLDIHAWCSSAGVLGCSISRDTTVTDSPYGGVPLKMSVTGNDPFAATYSATKWNIASASNGQTWTVRVLAKASVNTTMELFIFGARSTGTYISTDPVGAYTSREFNIGTSWAEYGFSFTFNNAEVAFIQTRLDGPNSGGSGQTVWFDGLQVYR